MLETRSPPCPKMSILRATTECSVSNGSGPSIPVRVRVLVGTEPLSDWRSWLSKDLNRQFGYGLMEIYNPSKLGRLSAGCPAGPFVDSYNALVFAA
jgi:hypothetical protein